MSTRNYITEAWDSGFNLGLVLGCIGGCVISWGIVIAMALA